MMWFSQKMAVEILVKAKLMREAYLTRSVEIVQRAYHRWRGKDVPPFRRLRHATIALQNHYRRRKVAVQVDYFRGLAGTRLKRFMSKPARLYPDKQGRLTRIERDFSVFAKSASVRNTKVVDIRALSSAQRELLGFAIAPIQAMAKFQYSVKRIEDIQRVWHGYVVRRDLKRKEQMVTKIQSCWRAKIARDRLRQVPAIIKIQANVRRILALGTRRRKQEAEFAEVFAAIADMGDEVVDGRRVRSGGSVSN